MAILLTTHAPKLEYPEFLLRNHPFALMEISRNLSKSGNLTQDPGISRSSPQRGKWKRIIYSDMGFSKSHKKLSANDGMSERNISRITFWQSCVLKTGSPSMEAEILYAFLLEVAEGDFVGKTPIRRRLGLCFN